MKIKTFKCPNCNASLELEEGAKEGVCEYCHSSFVIDDETIKIEHKIEFKDDSLEIAETTLNKFKDYDKSTELYRRLKNKYPQKKEVYIGLIRSITHDFTAEVTNLYDLRTVMDSWNKYASLATKTEITKYDSKTNKSIKDFFYKALINATNNFDIDYEVENLNNVKELWNNYKSVATTSEVSSLESKYKKFIDSKEKELNKKNKTKKIITISVIAVIIIAIVSYITILLTAKPKLNIDNINASEVSKNIINKDYFNKYLDSSNCTSKVVNAKVDDKYEKLLLTVNVKNMLKNKDIEYKINIKDDMGPIIEQVNCKFTDTENVDLNKCFKVYDITDKDIKSDHIKIDTNKNDFKVDGIKTIKVTATDKDSHSETKDIKVNITKTPITLDVTASKTSLYTNETTALTIKVSPKVRNMNTSITYDKEYLEKINNNTFKAIKKGNTKVCITSDYDNRVTECIDIKVNLKCLNTYIFNFSGSKKETLVADGNFCPGTYKVYATVNDYNKPYNIGINDGNMGYIDNIMIWKSTPHNEEGKKYTVDKGFNLEIAPGITKVKLVKVK